MLLSETKVTQQSHQKVLFGSVEHGCIVLQCNGGPLHADHENAITPSVDAVDALVAHALVEELAPFLVGQSRALAAVDLENPAAAAHQGPER